MDEYIKVADLDKALEDQLNYLIEEHKAKTAYTEGMAAAVVIMKNVGMKTLWHYKCDNAKRID